MLHVAAVPCGRRCWECWGPQFQHRYYRRILTMIRQLQKKYTQFSPKPYSKEMKIFWQLEMLFFCQLYTWLQFHLLMETTCKILITGWQLGTEEVMALLNAGRRFHQGFVNCPAYSLMWGNDSTVDLWSGPRSLSQTGSLCSMDVIWISCEQTIWDIMLPRCFYAGLVLPMGGTDWQMAWPGACQYKVE